jgi:curli production assembly/transport component CsgF
MNMIDRFALTALSCLLASSTAASELVYTPVNPLFGGHPHNGQTLLSLAQVTNKHKEPRDERFDETGRPNPLQQFAETLERSILSQLSSAAVSRVMGPHGTLQPGTVETGNFRITIVDAGGGILTITTTDKVTGASTSFQIGGQ